jgi:hypothetical protein
MTNSLLAAMLRAVSLSPSSASTSPSKPIATIAGWVHSTLKKLKGAALADPSALSVVTKAIGRGMIVLCSSLEASLRDRSLTFQSMRWVPRRLSWRAPGWPAPLGQFCSRICLSRITLA